MKHLLRIFAALLIYVGVVYLLRSRGTEEAPPPVAPEALQSVPSPQENELVTRQTEERIREFEAVARERQMVETARRDMEANRRQARVAATPAWTQVLSTNEAKYLSLLAKAKETPRGQVPCTLCDGLSYMPCVMCKDHDGKCLPCGGSGHLTPNVYCPSCLGKGKCFLCSGAGKMFCPFCNDGMIDINWPAPSPTPP